MFVCNKLCVYHELKANPMRPGCKYHDTPMQSPDGTSRRCVMCPRVLNGSAGAAPLILVIFFRSAQSISDLSVSQACIKCEQIFEISHLFKKNVFYWHSKCNHAFMKSYFGIRDERTVVQNDQTRQHINDIFRTYSNKIIEYFFRFSISRWTPRAQYILWRAPL